MHFSHIGAPGHNRIRQFNVVITTGRFIDPICLDEPDHCRSHTMAGVGIEIVGTESGFHQFGHGVAFLHGVLTGSENRNAGGAQLGQAFPHLFFNFIIGFLPGYGFEFAVFTEITVFVHPHQRLFQPVGPVHDLGIEISFDAIQSPVDRSSRISFYSHNFFVFCGHHDAATGAAKTAYCFVPPPVALSPGCQDFVGEGHPCRCGRGGYGRAFYKIPSVYTHNYISV